MDETVSIVIPAYNIEKEIERCVNSVISQTYQKLEVIIVNDGSTDRTSEVLCQLAKKDSRIRVTDKINEGVTKARLTGVEQATGEWIGFVDGDDYIEPDMYEHLISNAHKYGADISHCGYQMVFPSRADYYYNTGRLVEQDKITGLKDLLSGEFIEPGLWNKLFHKTLFHSLIHDNIMDLSIKNTEDLLMNYYLFAMSDRAVYEDFCPYHYLVREGSAANAHINENKLRDPLRVLKTIRREIGTNEVLGKIINARIAEQLISLSTMSLGDQKELIKPYRSKARKELFGMLPKLISGAFNMRLKVLSIWAAFFPASFRAVHAIYSHFRGTDRKYDIS